MNTTRDTTTDTTTVLQLHEVPLTEFVEKLGDIKFHKQGKGTSYADVPSCFDIETSSFYANPKTGAFRTDVKGLSAKAKKQWEKRACMCAWTFGINGASCIGRTWDELLSLLDAVSKKYGLSSSKRLIVYVHNLSYEIGFIQRRFKWEKIFALEERQPLYAVTESGIEFRCSYLLSGYGLAKVAEHLTEHHIKKMTGDWDYKKVRGSTTPLSDAERGYLLYDGYIVMAYIQEYINRVKHINNIPLTKTGAVRKACRDNCFYTVGNHHAGGTKYRRYKELMETLRINSVEEYAQAVRAFHGGFTHANPFRVRDVVEDVTSMDFTSSYPAVILSEMFPMSRAKEVEPKTREEFDKYMNNYCCIFDITFRDLESIIISENPISASKCFRLIDDEQANGRIVRCKECSLSMTNVDFSYLGKFYKWRNFTVRNMRVFYRGYLPRDFLLTVLEFYKKKTELKGVAGMEAEYAQAKEHCNSLYGCMVTAVCRNEITFDGIEWGKKKPDLQKSIDAYNTSRNRFLFYYWGVFVTSYAQKNLFTGIYECCGRGKRKPDGDLDLSLDDYCYSDTDSVKIRNFARNKAYFDAYNERIKRKMLAMCKARKIDPALIAPKTIEGVEKPLGVWDYDGHYKRFKTLGAKRYMIEKDDGTHNITVSGVNKKMAVPYLEKLAKEKNVDIFDLFDDDLIIPEEATGKNIHAYIDDEKSGVAFDYMGNAFEYDELSAVHLEETSYSLSMSERFMDYINGLREEF